MLPPLPDFKQRIYPPQRIIAAVDTLAEEGIAAGHALAGSGLEPGDLQDVSLRISYRQVIAVFRNALRLSCRQDFALRAGRRMHLTAYGMYGYALQSSRSHRDAIEFAGKYNPLVGGVTTNVFSCEDGVASYATTVMISHNPLSDLYRFALEFGLAAHLTILEDLYGPSFKLCRVDIVYPAPAHAAVYTDVFRCPALFNQPINQLRFDASAIDRPVALADRITHAMAHEVCNRLLGEVDHTASCSSDVRRALLQMPGRFPSLESMAATLSISLRQLRRRLDAEKTSYRDVVAEVRMDLAIRYLRETRLTQEEIASRLGYSDGANFRRAFTRWTGRNPSDFQGGGTKVLARHGANDEASASHRRR